MTPDGISYLNEGVMNTRVGAAAWVGAKIYKFIFFPNVNRSLDWLTEGDKGNIARKFKSSP